MDISGYSALSRHLEEKIIAYWHDVDFHWGSKASGHYTPDGTFLSPNARYEGREQIAEFYAWRKDRGERVNVHLVGNFYLRAAEGDRAEAHWICTLFAQDGPAPQPSAPPIAISRVEDVFLRQPDGEWLCRERVWHTLFRGGAKTTALSAAEMADRLARRTG
ncbi:MAG: nuclear transport factor 2 family protein [Chelatococcus sp.]|nr:nuclear transport factor 2 family protein [Chelatococcus sp.]